MIKKTAEKLWKAYPGWRLHCEVTSAGLESYGITMSMFNQNGDMIVSDEYYGSGDLNHLKEEAFEQLLTKLEQPTK